MSGLARTGVRLVVVAACTMGTATLSGAQTQPAPRLESVPQYSTHVYKPCPGQPRTFKALYTAYRRGRTPTVAELQGTWAATGIPYYKQPSDAESARSDLACTGLVRGKSGVFESVLLVRDDTLTVDRIGLGNRLLSAPIAFDAKGNLTFLVDDTGEMYNLVLSCRITTRRTLACLGGFDRPKHPTAFMGEEYAHVPVRPDQRSVGREQAATGVRLPPISVTVNPAQYPVRAADTISTWPLVARRAVLDSLAAGRRQWEANRPAGYRFSVGILCGFCGYVDPSRPPGTYPVARIRGREMVATGTFHPSQKINEGRWFIGTVDSLFGLLEREASDTGRKLEELRLDPVFGFPRSWTTDDARNGYHMTFWTDQNDWGRVELFVPDDPPAPCGWLRRLLRTCPAPVPPLDNEVRTRSGVDRMARPAADRPPPVYPPILEATAVDGSVRLRYAVDATGHVIHYSASIVASNLGEFMSAVFDLLEKSVFIPARLHGRRVAVWYEEEFDFRAPLSINAAASRDAEFAQLHDLFDTVPSVIRDTTPDGVPRTRIGFSPPGPSHDATFSRPELLEVQQSALGVMARTYALPDSATHARATLCVYMRRDSERVGADEQTLRMLSSPTRSAVLPSACPPTSGQLDEVDSLGRHTVVVPPGWSDPYWIEITRVLGWTQNQVRVWGEMSRGPWRRGFVCVAGRRAKSGWDIMCTQTALVVR
jgi:hypothetical protein